VPVAILPPRLASAAYLVLYTPLCTSLGHAKTCDSAPRSAHPPWEVGEGSNKFPHLLLEFEELITTRLY
jgi:hypothetical protein